jgi:hypothetical protein
MAHTVSLCPVQRSSCELKQQRLLPAAVTTSIASSYWQDTPNGNHSSPVLRASSVLSMIAKRTLTTSLYQVHTWQIRGESAFQQTRKASCTSEPLPKPSCCALEASTALFDTGGNVLQLSEARWSHGAACCLTLDTRSGCWNCSHMHYL